MTILVKKVFISSKPTFVYLLCPPLCGPFSIQESAAGGLSYKAKNEPSPFGIETEKAHLYCTTPVKRRRTLAALCLILRQHPVSDAKLIDDVALFTGRHAHFLADVLHVDLQLLDAAIV